MLLYIIKLMIGMEYKNEFNNKINLEHWVLFCWPQLWCREADPSPIPLPLAQKPARHIKSKSIKGKSGKKAEEQAKWVIKAGKSISVTLMSQLPLKNTKRRGKNRGWWAV